ncbi:hypothetical protein L6164_022978 [Bauhinia variegata]|uniref:Uncharacterized protein n=1 Tax=Bauhinia variegata TaxID=167791 RepID=A0ACB9MGV7_BAUVA|nr:hypothetical protein L6164_022978 [Bauhinia variegata]
MEESSRGRQAGRIAGKDVLSRPLSECRSCRALRGVKVEKVEVTQRGHVRRKYRVSGLTSQPTRELVFPVDDNSTMKSVVEYFQEMYGFTIQHTHLPCLQACKIVEGQHCTTRFIFDATRVVTGAYGKPIFVDKLGASLDSISNGAPLEDFGHGHPDANLTVSPDQCQQVVLWIVPTGWKFFGNLVDAGKLSIYGEESFGTGSDHIREKDGIWAVLAWLSILAQANKGKKPGEKLECESEGANKMVEYLRAFISKSKHGDKFGSYSLQFVDDFAFTDPMEVWYQNKVSGLFLQMHQELYSDYGELALQTQAEGGKLRFHFQSFVSFGAASRVKIMLCCDSSEQRLLGVSPKKLKMQTEWNNISKISFALHKTARHGAKTQDEEGRLRFHFQSFVSFDAASRTIMALWRTRLLTPKQRKHKLQNFQSRYRK